MKKGDGGGEKCRFWRNRAPDDPLFSVFLFFPKHKSGKILKICRKSGQIANFQLLCGWVGCRWVGGWVGRLKPVVPKYCAS